jgi:DNA integrity scanning protein DisA with diadenylate cyclase activity
MPESPVYHRLTQAILEAVADDVIAPGCSVVALYSGFEADVMDSVSLINLGEHLDRLTGRDLRQLETRVPLDTLRLVVDLAVEIGREGREGKPIGTMLVVGDTRKVLAASRPAGFDPVRGYSRKERNLNDPRVREGIKEIAQMDGAILVAHDGTVEATCRYVDAPASALTLSKGLGSRHWAAAAISRATKAVAVTVSQSNGTVRIFQNGEVVLRIEPLHRRPMVWKDFEYEPPAPDARPKGKTET